MLGHGNTLARRRDRRRPGWSDDHLARRGVRGSRGDRDGRVTRRRPGDRPQAGGRGYAVVVNYLHDQRAAEATVETVLAGNGAAVAVRADVADELDVQRLFAETIEAFGGVDVVVHTVARMPRPSPSSDTDPSTGTIAAAAGCVAGGAIVNLTSSAAPLAEPRTPRGHDRHRGRSPGVLALELRERDITVNGVALAVDGPCAPNRIADAVAYLLSDEGTASPAT